MKNLIHVFMFAATAFFFVSCQGKTGETAETGSAETVAVASDASVVFHVVPDASKIIWEGYRPLMTVTHHGTVQISEGKLAVKDGMIESGSFLIDMHSIVNLDLEGDRKAYLEDHLKGTAEGKEDDFFNATQFPTGKFEITKVTALENDAEGNTMIYGNLTLRDVTKSVGFKANVNMAEGVITATTPLFKIDRTEWNVKALSNKFFDNLREKFVDDQIGLRVELRAETGKDI